MTTASTTAALLPRAWVNEARAAELLRTAEVLAGVKADADLPDDIRGAAEAAEPAVLALADSLAKQAAADALEVVSGA